MKHYNLFFLLSILLSSCGGNKPSALSLDNTVYDSTEYCNPLNVTKSGGSLDFKGPAADPSIVKGDDGKFYCFTTDRYTFVSDDGVNFEQLDYDIIDWPTWGNAYSNGKSVWMWAPDVMKVKDKWIYYYSLAYDGGSAGIGYGIADTCAGPYVDQGKLFSSIEIGNTNLIDPQPFMDDDGQLYMLFGSFKGIFIVELSDDGMSLNNTYQYWNENKTLLAGHTLFTDFSTYEGSYLTKHGDDYVLFLSSGSCCVGSDSTYRVVTGKSKSILGPYKDDQGIDLRASGNNKTYGTQVVSIPMRLKDTLAGPGHNSVYVDDAGDWWMYYHCYSKNDGFLNRKLFIDKLLWDDNDYPYIEDHIPSFEEIKDGPRMRFE